MILTLQIKHKTILACPIKLYVPRRFAGGLNVPLRFPQAIIIATPRPPTPVIPHGLRPTHLVIYVSPPTAVIPYPLIPNAVTRYVPRSTSVTLYRNVVRSVDPNGYITEITGIIPSGHIPRSNNDHIPITTQTREFDEWERNTPEYYQAIINRFSPVISPRISNNPYINHIHHEIIEFMHHYYDLGINTGTEIINRFRRIQFDPSEIGSVMYNRFMTLFNRLSNVMNVEATMVIDVPFGVISSDSSRRSNIITVTSSQEEANNNFPLLINSYPLPCDNQTDYVEAKIDVFDPKKLSAQELEEYRRNVERILVKYSKHKIIGDEDLSILENYQKIIQHPETSESYKSDISIYNEISQIMLDAPKKETILPKLTRDQEEYSILKNYKNAERVIQLLAQERPSHCYLPEEFEHIMNLDREILAILIDYGHNQLYTPHWIELLRRSGILVNNDALYFGGIVEEGETHKITGTTFQDMIDMCEDTGEKLTDIEYNIVIENIQRGVFIEGYHVRDEELLIKNAEILSGHDLHPLIFVEDPRDKDSYLCVGTMTSAKDKGTVLISKNQSYGGARNKEQHMRPATRLTRIPKHQVRQDTHVKHDTENNKKNIIDVLIQNCASFKDSTILHPLTLDKTILTKLAMRALEKRILDNQQKLSILVKEINNLPEKERNNYIDKLKNLKEKDKQKQIENAANKNMPQPFKILNNIRHILKQNINKVKTNEQSVKRKTSVDENKVKAKEKRDATNKKSTNNDENKSNNKRSTD